MRLLYLHTRDRNSGPEGFKTEGLHYLFMQLTGEKIVDEITVCFDTCGRKPELTWALPNYVFRNLQGITPDLLQLNDIVFIRGGFKPWLPFIDYCQKSKYWLLFYGANTGRARWPFWDIVFDDLSGDDKHFDTNGRIYLDWRKPIHPNIFRPKIDSIDIKYDVCIGASHIHDKKGQWRGVEIAAAYRRKFGTDIRCIMPGALRRGERTQAMMERMHGLDIQMPGMVSRYDLADIYRSSRVFLHLGTGGQGDRGPMEAMACGCEVIIGFPMYHSPYILQPPYCTVPEDPDDFDRIAEYIHNILRSDPAPNDVARYFQSKFSINDILFPRMKALFSVLRDNPVAARSALSNLKWAECR